MDCADSWLRLCCKDEFAANRLTRTFSTCPRLAVGLAMSNGYRLISGPQPVTTAYIQRLLVRLAVRGPLRWLLCGNHLDLQGLIYEVAQRANGDYYHVLENNVALVRAETCYQVVGLLRRTAAAKIPTLITDLLANFYDDGVRDDEAAELFGESLHALRKLSQGGPVVVSASCRNERPGLYAALRQSAKHVILL